MDENLADNPHIIIKGFWRAGIYTAPGLLDDDDDDDDLIQTRMILVLNLALIQVMRITCLNMRSQVQIPIALKEEKLGRKYAVNG